MAGRGVSMEFFTELTKEQIRIRLRTRAELYTYWNRLANNTYLARWNDDDSFYLHYTGDLMLARNGTTFIGKVEKTETGETVIRGEFGYTKVVKVEIIITLVILIGFICGVMVPPVVSSDGIPVSSNAFFLVLILGVTIVTAYLLMRLPRGLGEGIARNAVVVFIQKNLVR